MIAIDFNLSDPLNWLLLALVVMLLFVQMWILFKNRTETSQKRNVRIVLNLVLWLLTLAFILQPYWNITSSSKNVLVVGGEVPESMANHVKDSLGSTQVYTQEDFVKKNYDTVMLLGQDFKRDFFASLSQSNQANLSWIPYYQPDQLQSIQWDGILKKGQLQHIRGSIQSSKEQLLTARYANNTLDSVLLKKGFNSFDLQFPVFAQGRIIANLDLNHKTVDTIRFFAQAAQAKVYQFVLDSPDFESKTLADWLGKNGNAVIISTVLSKNIQSSKTINKTSEPDVFITDPANSSHVTIKKALANGKSILLLGLDQAEKDFVVLNNALGSKLGAERISQEMSIPVSEGLTALPYKFASSGRSYTIPGLPVAITRTNARIGVSLLNETYPLMLSGDSVAYNKIWTSILARIAPPDTSNLHIMAPVYKGITNHLQLNNVASRTNSIEFEEITTGKKTAKDTIFPDYSSINNKTANAGFSPSTSGSWMRFGAPFPETEVYVEDGQDFKQIMQSHFIRDFTNAYDINEESTSINLNKCQLAVKKTLPVYVWFLLFIVCFTAIWAEPKFFS